MCVIGKQFSHEFREDKRRTQNKINGALNMPATANNPFFKDGLSITYKKITFVCTGDVGKGGPSSTKFGQYKIEQYPFFAKKDKKTGKLIDKTPKSMFDRLIANVIPAGVKYVYGFDNNKPTAEKNAENNAKASALKEANSLCKALVCAYRDNRLKDAKELASQLDNVVKILNTNYRFTYKLFEDTRVAKTWAETAHITLDIDKLLKCVVNEIV